ncbi:MAG: Integrase [Chloroflexi bacterium]|nr:MAG: Integrase [Chloroflexota bacterium]
MGRYFANGPLGDFTGRGGRPISSSTFATQSPLWGVPPHPLLGMPWPQASFGYCYEGGRLHKATWECLGLVRPAQPPPVSNAHHPIPTNDVVDDLVRELLFNDHRPAVTEGQKAWGPFAREFRFLPVEWQPIREFLEFHWTGSTGRTRFNRQSSLRRLYQHAIDSMRLLERNPVAPPSKDSVDSAGPNPLGGREAAAVDALEKSPRDQAIWHLAFGHGWRPIEQSRLTAGDVRRVGDDRLINRRQKRRSGQPRRTPSPVLPETMALLGGLGGVLADDETVFRAVKNGLPLSSRGIGDVLRAMLRQASVEAAAYDVRDTFATWVFRFSRRLDVAQRLLGHASGGVTDRYVQYDLLGELEEFSPLRLLRSGKPSQTPREFDPTLQEKGGTPGEIRTPVSGSGGQHSIP